jgi:hypothetical protein
MKHMIHICLFVIDVRKNSCLRILNVSFEDPSIIIDAIGRHRERNKY